MQHSTSAKYKTLAIIIFIFGLITVFVLKVIPLLGAAMLSVKEYDPVKGFFNSPYAGAENFKQIINNEQFPRIIMNTAVSNLAAFVMCITLSVVLSLGLNFIRGKGLKIAFASIFMLSFAAAPVVYPAVLLRLLPSEMLINASFYPILYGSAVALRFAPVAALFSLAFSQGGRSTGRMFAGILVFAIAMCAMPFSSQKDAALLLGNPLNYGAGNIIDMYVFQTGFMQMNYGPATALWILKFILNLISSLVCIIIVMLIIRALKSKPVAVKNADAGPNATGIIISSIYSLLVIGIYVCAFASSGATGTVPARLVITWGAALISMLPYAALSGALCLALAYPLCRGGKFVKISYALLLAPALYVSAGSIHQFLVYRMAGLFDNLSGVILSYSAPIALVFAYALYYHSQAQREGVESVSFIKVMFPAFVAGSALWFTVMWTECFNNMIYAASYEMKLPAMLIYEAARNGSALPLGALIMTVLPPALTLAAGAAVISILRRPEKR